MNEDSEGSGLTWKYNKKFDSLIRVVGIDNSRHTKPLIIIRVEAPGEDLPVKVRDSLPLLLGAVKGIAFAQLRMATVGTETVWRHPTYVEIPNRNRSLAVVKVYDMAEHESPQGI